MHRLSLLPTAETTTNSSSAVEQNDTTGAAGAPQTDIVDATPKFGRDGLRRVTEDQCWLHRGLATAPVFGVPSFSLGQGEKARGRVLFAEHVEVK